MQKLAGGNHRNWMKVPGLTVLSPELNTATDVKLDISPLTFWILKWQKHLYATLGLALKLWRSGVQMHPHVPTAACGTSLLST